MKLASSPFGGILVGCGFFGRIQLDAWTRVKGAKIVALCDTDAAQASRAATEFGISRFYTSLEEALAAERPEFVDIATRPDSHLVLTKTTAAAGCAVLCQKPL